MTASLLLLASLPAATPVTDVKLPPGFAAYLYSDQALANDIYTLTVDDDGRVLVAGKGYVRVLIDENGDGRADRSVTLLDGLKDGPMGLLAEGDSLYVVADGGLKRYRGYTGTTKLTAPPEVVFAVKTGGEHEAHAVRRGPDGWLYLLCGNMSGVKKEQLDPLRSPVIDPVAGSLLRISPDGKTVEAVCDGFRNAYGFDFNLAGEPFAYDSDNERCVGLPWYEPCRFYHCVPGGNHGWRSPQLSQTWRKPPYFADVVPPVCTTGRGSPTGVACYRNTHFPGPYRGNFFIADWTFGRVYFVPLAAKGSTWAGKPEVFLEAVGESGFAPTGLAVHPKTGELFVSIGGRGTRGAVYRITHERGGPAKQLPMTKRSLDWTAGAEKEWVTDATGADVLKRRQAMELLLRWREKIGSGPWLGDAVKPNLGHEDALVRAAAGRMVSIAAAPVGRQTDPLAKLTVALATVGNSSEESMRDALDVLGDKYTTFEHKLIAARLVQLALGDLTAPGAAGTVAEGYTFRKPVSKVTAARILAVLAPRTDGFAREPLPSTPELNREIARIVGGIGAAGKDEVQYRNAEWIGKQCGRKDSTVEADFHYLAAMSQMSPYSLRDVDGWASLALVGLDEKVARQKVATDRNWPLRLDELCAALIPRHSFLSGTILKQQGLGRPGHLPIIKHLKIDAAAKATLFINNAGSDPNYPWTPGVVQMLADAPVRARPVLLSLWDRGGFEDTIVPILARDPDPADGPKFVLGLRSLSPDVVKVSADALNHLPPQRDKVDVIAAVGALRRLPDDKATTTARAAVTTLLRDRTGQTFGADPKAWAGWFAGRYPDLATKLTVSDGFDPAAWTKRAAGIPWADGDPVRGRAAFAKATCATCHDGGGAVGPSLVGVAKRFSRDDLLTAVIQPSKDVSPRYRPTRITTTDGKAYIGMIVYEATSGVILQTGPDAVVRIAGEQIESQRLLDTSLMPAGLLDKLTDREVADLLAYLRSS